MVRFLSILALVLAFPVLEAWVLFRLGEAFGWWVAVWLIAAAVGGLLLIRLERLVWALRVATSLREQRSPLGALLTSARSVVAGVLLIFPGVVSDLLALLALLWPLPKGQRGDGARPGEPGVIEGEFRREPRGDRLPPER
jgi:UPF0716 protein FxsA